MLGKSVYVLLRISGFKKNKYRLIYRNIGFLSHQIFVSLSALKILYWSGSSNHLAQFPLKMTSWLTHQGDCRPLDSLARSVTRVCSVCSVPSSVRGAAGLHFGRFDMHNRWGGHCWQSDSNDPSYW